jgi:hypothetical protein
MGTSSSARASACSTRQPRLHRLQGPVRRNIPGAVDLLIASGASRVGCGGQSASWELFPCRASRRRWTSSTPRSRKVCATGRRDLRPVERDPKSSGRRQPRGGRLDDLSFGDHGRRASDDARQALLATRCSLPRTTRSGSRPDLHGRRDPRHRARAGSGALLLVGLTVLSG